MTAKHDRRPGHARRKARRYAVQALYQWGMTGDDVGAIEGQFLEEYGLKADEREYFHELLHGIPGRLDEIDAALLPALDRPVAQVDPVEQAILRLAAWELLVRLDIPFQVVIHEAVELARAFGAAEGHKFVNAVLDHTARRLRAVEAAAG